MIRICNEVTVLQILFQVDDKITLLLRLDQREDTAALVSKTVIRLATDDLMSPSLLQNVSH